MSITLCLVDTLEVGKKVLTGDDNVVLAADNPLLAEALTGLKQCISLDSFISTEDALKIGHFGVDIAQKIDIALQTSAIGDYFSIDPSRIKFASRATSLLTSQVYRASSLAKGVAELDLASVNIKANSGTSLSSTEQLCPDRFYTPWGQLASGGFFGDTTVRIENTNQLAPKFTQALCESLIRRIVALSPMAILGLLACKPIVSGTLRRLGRPVVLIESENELVRETMGWLALRFVALQKIPSRKSISFTENCTEIGECNLDIYQGANIIQRDIGPIIQNGLKNLSWFNSQQINAITKYIVWRYVGALSNFGLQMKSYCNCIDIQTMSLSHKTVVLSNSTLGPEAKWLHEHLKTFGIPIFGFEHGVTTGLSKHSNSKLGFSEMTNCDVGFVYSDSSAKNFKSNSNTQATIYTTGAPTATRKINFQSLQKYLTRFALKIPLQSPTVMHVDTVAFLGNMRAGPYAYTESEIVNFHRRLTSEAYNDLKNWTVLFKEYPTQRFQYSPGIKKYAGTVKNMRCMSQEDFRYMRTAADVLVTTMPSSTLGWCVGTNIPLIWLESPITPILNDEALDDFKNSFFVIDMNENDWPLKLKTLLNCGLMDIREKWMEKSKERARTIEKYIFGPNISSGKACADTIMAKLKPT